MSAMTGGSRVRKACLQCIRAKAKCSLSEHRPDECHRCIRLNKQCAFEVVAKKPGPGPKSRSRVRQLEQRVESLIDLIATKNSDVPPKGPLESDTPIQVVTPASSTDSHTTANPATSSTAAKEQLCRPWSQAAPFQAYDPVDAGLISEDYAYRLVDEFKQHFVWCFPFVVVDVDGPTLRRQEPFLFHAILTVTAYEAAGVQSLLSDKLRHEIARVVEHSRKSLGILQGLLVYGGWYHGFYHPVTQQLTVLVQLCVAMVQDLGLSKKPRAKPPKWSMADTVAECGPINRTKGTLHEKRAVLGTYFLSVVFAQAWRKQTTLPFNRFMAQSCDAFNGSQTPSDVLISPLVKASELLSRATDHFSYHDIDNAEIRGEVLLSMSINSFLAELQHIKDFTSFSPLLKDNIIVTLMLSLVEIAINEACLHTPLWSTSSQSTPVPKTPIRLKMLHRTMQGATSYLKTLLRAPQPLLYQLSLGSWCGWFYIFVVMCKLVFLEENERSGHTEVEDMAGEINNLMPEDMLPDNFRPHRPKSNDSTCGPAVPGDSTSHASWNALAITDEYDLIRLSEQVMKKLTFSLPDDFVPWMKPREERDSLYPISCIHKTMLQGFRKRIERLASGNATNPSANDVTAAAPPFPQGFPSTTAWQAPHTDSDDARRVLPLPFNNFMNFDALNFDGMIIPSATFPQEAGQETFGDIMWDMVMDGFTMPQL